MRQPKRNHYDYDSCPNLKRSIQKHKKSRAQNMTGGDNNDAEGSWIPSLAVAILILLWWISRSQSTYAVQIRRWYNVKRLQWKKKLGLRDESIYRNFSAGDGANQKYKRQG